MRVHPPAGSIVIGSRALVHHLGDRFWRAPRDLDLIVHPDAGEDYLERLVRAGHRVFVNHFQLAPSIARVKMAEGWVEFSPALPGTSNALLWDLCTDVKPRDDGLRVATLEVCYALIRSCELSTNHKHQQDRAELDALGIEMDRRHRRLQRRRAVEFERGLAR